MNENPKIKKEKLGKLIGNNGKDTEHELSYYINDKVKLMKEVLKIIKPKKIRSMAPSCIRKLDNAEINSMLLEELLGISNKRLKYIFNGQNLEEDSSTDEEQHPDDIISLDDISDDDFVIDLDSDKETANKRCKKHRSKIEVETKKIKREKHGSGSMSNKHKLKTNEENEQNLMSVLELLELQARARAIRSQLALENQKKMEDRQKLQEPLQNLPSDDDEVIVESPKNEEIIITSSDSENDEGISNKNATGSIDCEKQSSVEMKNTNNNGKDGDIATDKDDTDKINMNKTNQILVHHIDIIQKSAKVDETSSDPHEDTNADETSKVDEKLNHKNCSRKDLINNTHVKIFSDTCQGSIQCTNEEKTSHDDADGIVLNVEQSDMDCINLE